MTRLKIGADGTTEVQKADKHLYMDLNIRRLVRLIDNENKMFGEHLAELDPECAKMIADELKEFSDNLKTACEAMGY